MNFVDSLKRWFFTNNSSAAGSAARIPLLDANGVAVGSDTYNAISEIVRQELGKILNGGTVQTTGITKVPSLVGNALGATTVANLASVLGGVKGYEFPGDGNNKWYKVIDVTNQKSFAFFVAHDFYRNVSPAIYLITGYMYDTVSTCSVYYLIGGYSKDYVRERIKVKVDSSTKRLTIWINLIGSGTFSHVIPIAGSIPLSRVEETPPEDAVNPTFVN